VISSILLHRRGFEFAVYMYIYIFFFLNRKDAVITKSINTDCCHMDYALCEQSFTALTSVNLTVIPESPENFEV